MIHTIVCALLCLFLSFTQTQNVYAASQNDCAIWLCLPAGFPSGCGGAYSAFKGRVKHGRPPLPNLASCTTGPYGERVSGRYEMGREEYEPCKEGYVLKRRSWAYQSEAVCVVERCSSQSYSVARNYCEGYEAVIRQKSNFIKIWVSNEFMGQFFIE